MPKTLWIELTSKCPFDCIFCSRKLDRGAGEHMEIGLYRSLISQLERPELIRLNYSGESIHYPHLEEAIRLARATGAVTELVSAFSSITPGALRGLVDAGLDRLSISLHSVDADEYRRIYGFGSLETLFERIDELAAYKKSRGVERPEVDFAFVAMEANLGQLAGVAAYAQAAGATQVSIHPVIRRSPILYEFPAELTGQGELRREFAARLEREVAAVRAANPEVSVNVARPDARSQPAAGLTTCEQNPWETVHVLANGDAVVCEVQDKVTLGNLHTQSLREIWQGETYRSLRRRYLAGDVPACRACPWRRTTAWEEVRESVAAGPGGAAQMVRGWHSPGDGQIAWSRGEAALVVRRAGTLQLSGMLPPGPARQSNVLTVRSGGRTLARVANDSGAIQPFELRMRAQGGGSHHVLEFTTSARYCPAKEGTGRDLRELGFALISLAPEDADLSRREHLLDRIFANLRKVDRWSARAKFLAPPFALKPSPRWAEPGVSIVIPERANVKRLGRCLESAAAAASRLSDPVETIVVVNGSEPEEYAALRQTYPAARFLFDRVGVGFTRAVRRGLEEARFAWSYLLNNDMVLEPDALAQVVRLRSPRTFAIASRIEMEDAALAGTETNWTGYRYEGGVVGIYEKDPRESGRPRASLYAGGGSALFQTEVLRRLIRRSNAYAPFYWEDVEWGAMAWRHGFWTVFCPDSCARHGYRSTVRKFYSPAEIERIFERNRYLFQLRNLNLAESEGLRKRLATVDAITWRELFEPKAFASLMYYRAVAALAPYGEEVLRERDQS